MANKRGREPSADGGDVDKIRAEIEQEKQMRYEITNAIVKASPTCVKLCC